jgi:hypothetical protein
LAIDRSKIIGIRAGERSRHRFIGIWAVVVNGRVVARSWTEDPDGWYHAFLKDPAGAMQLGERRIPIRAARARGERIRDAVEDAYAGKYSTPDRCTTFAGFGLAAGGRPRWSYCRGDP